MKAKKLFSVLTLILLLGSVFVACNNVTDSDLEETGAQIVAANENAANFNISVEDKVATISGTVEDEATKSRIESAVAAIDGVESVINNIKVVPVAPPVVVDEEAEEEEEVSDQVVVATIKGKLNVHSKPGVQEHVIAVVDHGETLTLVEKTNADWWLIQTDTGLKGYSYSPYLEEQ